MPRYDQYKILAPSGEWEKWRVPRFFTSRDVAKHRPHSTICLFVPVRHSLFGKSEFGESVRMDGPCWAVWNREKDEHVGPFKAPEELPFQTLWAAEGPQVVQAIPG